MLFFVMEKQTVPIFAPYSPGEEKKRMLSKVTAVIGTNAWGDALYGKMLRGSYVEEDVIRDAV